MQRLHLEWKSRAESYFSCLFNFFCLLWRLAFNWSMALPELEEDKKTISKSPANPSNAALFTIWAKWPSMEVVSHSEGVRIVFGRLEVRIQSKLLNHNQRRLAACAASCQRRRAHVGFILTFVWKDEQEDCHSLAGVTSLGMGLWAAKTSLQWQDGLTLHRLLPVIDSSTRPSRFTAEIAELIFTHGEKSNSSAAHWPSQQWIIQEGTQHLATIKLTNERRARGAS